MKVKITIEYDNDEGEPDTVSGKLDLLRIEVRAWTRGHIGLNDVLGGPGNVVMFETEHKGERIAERFET